MKLSLAQNICRLRKQNGLTQERLAEALGVTFAAVSKWERGVATPDLGLMAELASLFSVSLDALAGFELVFTLVTRAGTTVLVGTEIGMLTIVKRHDPLALGLEVDSVGAGGGAQHHGGGQSESHKLLHDNTFLHYFRIFRSHPLRDLFPLRDPIPDLCGAGQESRPIRPELKARF